MAILPISAELSFTTGNEFLSWLYYVVADQDYEIIAVSAAPDTNAVTAGTFGVFIGRVYGGTSTTGQFGSAGSTSAAASGTFGNILEGWLQDPTDPTKTGTYAVQLLASLGLNLDFYKSEDRPTIKKGDILAIIVTQSHAGGNNGVVAVQVIGRPVNPRGYSA